MFFEYHLEGENMVAIRERSQSRGHCGAGMTVTGSGESLCGEDCHLHLYIVSGLSFFMYEWL